MKYNELNINNFQISQKTKKIYWTTKKSSDLAFFWKPHWIPTTYWKQKCFLEMINTQNLNKNLKEFGLLNRLDNETCWLVYFAKTQETFEKFKELQKKHKTIKTYLAIVYWQIKANFFWINKLIDHHKTDSTKMTTNNNFFKAKWQPAQTFCQKLFYDKKNNQTWLEVQITKWVRHQIRCHLASIWHPIVNDKLYINKKIRKKLWISKIEWNLQLFSIWLKIID